MVKYALLCLVLAFLGFSEVLGIATSPPTGFASAVDGDIITLSWDVPSTNTPTYILTSGSVLDDMDATSPYVFVAPVRDTYAFELKAQATGEDLSSAVSTSVDATVGTIFPAVNTTLIEATHNSLSVDFEHNPNVQFKSEVRYKVHVQISNQSSGAKECQYWNLAQTHATCRGLKWNTNYKIQIYAHWDGSHNPYERIQPRFDTGPPPPCATPTPPEIENGFANCTTGSPDASSKCTAGCFLAAQILDRSTTFDCNTSDLSWPTMKCIDAKTPKASSSKSGTLYTINSNFGNTSPSKIVMNITHPSPYFFKQFVWTGDEVVSPLHFDISDSVDINKILNTNWQFFYADGSSKTPSDNFNTFLPKCSIHDGEMALCNQDFAYGDCTYCEATADCDKYDCQMEEPWGATVSTSYLDVIVDYNFYDYYTYYIMYNGELIAEDAGAPPYIFTVPVAENGTVGVAQDYANYYDQSPFTEFSVVTTFPEPNGTLASSIRITKAYAAYFDLQFNGTMYPDLFQIHSKASEIDGDSVATCECYDGFTNTTMICGCEGLKSYTKYNVSFAGFYDAGVYGDVIYQEVATKSVCGNGIIEDAEICDPKISSTACLECTEVADNWECSAEKCTRVVESQDCFATPPPSIAASCAKCSEDNPLLCEVCVNDDYTPLGASCFKEIAIPLPGFSTENYAVQFESMTVILPPETLVYASLKLRPLQARDVTLPSLLYGGGFDLGLVSPSDNQMVSVKLENYATMSVTIGLLPEGNDADLLIYVDNEWVRGPETCDTAPPATTYDANSGILTTYFCHMTPMVIGELDSNESSSSLYLIGGAAVIAGAGAASIAAVSLKKKKVSEVSAKEMTSVS